MMGPFELLEAGDTSMRIAVGQQMSARELLESIGCSKPIIARVLTGGQLTRDLPASAGAVAPACLSYEDVLNANDTVTLRFSHERQSLGMSHELVEVIYEDRFILAVDKPAGLLVHSDGTGASTLTARVQGYLAGHGSTAVAQAVQRLDVETTGIVLFSLSEEFQPVFDRMVEDGSIRKRYLAIVPGRFPSGLQTINQPIGRDRHDAQRMRVSATGKPATTYARRIATAAGKSLVAVEIDSGRRHQIRVHLAWMGYPIVGDRLYGDTDSLGRNDAGLMLHAYEERLTHPLLGQALDLTTPWPARFARWFSETPVDKP